MVSDKMQSKLCERIAANYQGSWNWNGDVEMTDEEKNEMFSKVFKQFLKSHKGCYHFSDHIYARDLFDIILKEIEEYAKAIDEKNEELKAQIEKMKCCDNCSKGHSGFCAYMGCVDENYKMWVLRK